MPLRCPSQRSCLCHDTIRGPQGSSEVRPEAVFTPWFGSKPEICRAIATGCNVFGPSFSASQKAIFSDKLIANGDATSPETWTLTELWVHSLDKTLAKIGIGSTALAVDLQKYPKMSPNQLQTELGKRDTQKSGTTTWLPPNLSPIQPSHDCMSTSKIIDESDAGTIADDL